MGLPATGINGFGVLRVWGRSLLPWPAIGIMMRIAVKVDYC